MKVSDFDFDLPNELIATHPLDQRDASRMLLVPGNEDKHITDFISYLRPGDVVVFNNSKVIPARFDAAASDGTKYEITLHTTSGNDWLGFAKKFNKLKVGEILTLGDSTKIEVLDKNDDSGLLLKFHCENLSAGALAKEDVFDVLDRVGKMPLPPYMKREEEQTDRERYQTVYADPAGSMAAPTAGLHFTPQLLDAVRAAGAQIVNITLHVGAGTWAPVKSDDTAQHKMHSEWGCITVEQAAIINAAKRVIAVGTTSLRLLESAGGKPFCGTTDIFITPGYKFKVVDVLLTNFHLPRSTLFMLVSAFAGLAEMRAAYAHAVLEKYRFFSYGDCCLLFRKN
ncbi:MAG: tRNA preQ1(34) S-adenosylmethionine ribosyltransferase-isomerase QueA [Alphaproteobacteria bacterium]|nr:tRNA preQ1(34) S-adenosylmethionine ribosyltransferase-isomerase QueA [Alphaproteobacteria bacterium]